jgi:hypothetical protein
MKNPDELRASRAAAGTRYATAAREYIAAWVELEAHNRAASNAAISDATHAPGFAEEPAAPLRHPEFLPDGVDDGQLADRVRARLHKLLDSTHG